MSKRFTYQECSTDDFIKSKWSGLFLTTDLKQSLSGAMGAGDPTSDLSFQQKTILDKRPLFVPSFLPTTNGIANDGSESNSSISILIPTFNGGPLWEKVLESINRQDMRFYKKIIVDSGSNDQTEGLAVKYGFEVIKIAKTDFNHGTARQLLVNHAKGSDICILMTQDAIPATRSSISNLVSAFNDPDISLAYGRQLPHDHAGVLETHARLFNYPDQSEVRSYQDKEKFGFKVFFCSDAFAAYRISSLIEVGGFPGDSIMGEDAIVAAKLLLSGYKVAYVSEATVQHSHSYSFLAQFKRYFDTRVFHEQNSWLIEKYGKPTGEGIKYVRSELKFILKRKPALLLNAFSSLFAKWLGYTLGGFYAQLPKSLLKKLSMHKSYWK